jgi:hypothetical protein
MPLGLALGLALLAAGCTEPAPPDGPAVTGGVVRLEAPVASAHPLDLLFVIDSSPGMAPQRAKLIDGYRRAIERLEALPGGLPDLRIGVITADVGTRGANDPGPGPSIGTGPGSCTSDGDRGELRRAEGIGGNFLFDAPRPDGSSDRNYAGSLAEAFVRLADVGASGCTYARPLEAMRRALIGNPANAGFRRDRASLAVVLLTSDDDCSFGGASFTGGDLDRSRCQADAGSLVAVEEYVAALRSTAVDQRRVHVLGGFLPPGAPSCADARPAPRLAAFLDGFPHRSHAVSICEPDLGGLLSSFALSEIRSLELPCFGDPPLDLDPATDGLQADCAAWYSYVDHDLPVEEILPPCRGDELGPCWWFRHEPAWCPPDGRIFELREPRRRGFIPGTRARAIIECVSR